MRGQFILFPDDEDRKLIVPNTLTEEGENALLQMAFQGNNAIVANGGNFYVGLCGQNLNGQGLVDRTKALATLAGEPTLGGYARQTLARSAVGWPTLQLINGVWAVTTAVVNYTASGADIGVVYRAFIASTNDNSGKLFCLSGQFPGGQNITNGQTFPLQYQLFLN